MYPYEAWIHKYVKIYEDICLYINLHIYRHMYTVCIYIKTFFIYKYALSGYLDDNSNKHEHHEYNDVYIHAYIHIYIDMCIYIHHKYNDVYIHIYIYVNIYIYIYI
jgi:hypothetical protein